MRTGIAGLWVGLLLVGCEPVEEAPPASEAAPEPRVVEIATSDYALSAPDTIAAGLVTFRMNAGGQAFHHAQLVRFDEGHTFADFMTAMATADGPPPAWAHPMGGPNGADPGGTVETTVHLEPGAYGIICVIPGPDGVPHLAMGMGRALTVTGPAVPEERPATAVTLTMADSTFQLSGPIPAGRAAVLVENTVDTHHEAIFVRLADGATADDLVQWMVGGASGPPPASGAGGTVALARGGWNVVHTDFTPGNYAVVDFTPHPSDGRPQAAHGMVLPFTVE